MIWAFIRLVLFALLKGNGSADKHRHVSRIYSVKRYLFVYPRTSLDVKKHDKPIARMPMGIAFPLLRAPDLVPNAITVTTALVSSFAKSRKTKKGRLTRMRGTRREAPDGSYSTRTNASRRYVPIHLSHVTTAHAPFPWRESSETLW